MKLKKTRTLRAHQKKRPSPTLVSKDHEGDRQDGHTDRLNAYTKRALELSRTGHIYADIAKAIAQEFQLERVPCVATIHNWLTKGDLAYERDIAALRYELRMMQFNRLEKLLVYKWLPIAMAHSLEITRWKMVAGALQPELDARSLAEQLRATDQVVKIMGRQAKLLGLDLQDAIDHKKDGPKTLQELSGQEPMKALPMRSGIEGLEED